MCISIFSWKQKRRAEMGKVLLMAAMTVVIIVSSGHKPARQILKKCPPKTDVRHGDINFMAPSELMKYVYWNNQSACRITNDLSGVINALLPDEKSGVSSQKLLCMDPNVRLKENNCVVYIFGNHNEWVDEHNFVGFGCHFYIFDPALEAERHEGKMHFYDLGLADEDTDHDPITGWKLRTLGSLYNMLKPRHGNVFIDYVKMDAEKAELMAVAQIIRTGMLAIVKQMGVEIHFHHGVPIDPYLRVYLKMLRPLEQQGMIRFASRAIYFNKGNGHNQTRDTIFELFWINQMFL